VTGDRLRKVLLAYGPLSALVYIGHELAALQWEGCGRIYNAISELYLTGEPSRWMLEPWEGLVHNALVIALGAASGDRPTAAERYARSVAVGLWRRWSITLEHELSAEVRR
jgi:hypothetical protein